MRSEWTIRRNEEMGDWYTIEKKESYGEGQFIADSPNSAFWYDPARVADACVEGTRVEMLAIADAIDAKGKAHFKRCAVAFLDDDHVFFWSPRNSRMAGMTWWSAAKQLADEIRETLAQPPCATELPSEGQAKP